MDVKQGVFSERFKPQAIAGESVAARIIKEKALVYHVRVKKGGGDWFYIVEVPLAKLKAFQSAMTGTEHFTITDYGEVLHSGRGNPSEALRTELRDKYGMYEGE